MGFNQAYNVGVSDVDSTTLISVEGDHTIGFMSLMLHTNNHKLTQQHGRNASISRSDARFGVDVSTQSTNRNNLLDDYDDVVTTHTCDKDLH